MKSMFSIAAVSLFLLWPTNAEARGHRAARGERRIGNVVKKLLHPVQTLKERRANR